MKNAFHKLPLETVHTQIAYTGRKISTCFQIKDKSKFYHQHDLVYHAKCPSKLWDENYIRESGRCITERVKDQNARDYKMHILKHSIETGHEHVLSSDFFNHSQEPKRKQKNPVNCRVVTYWTIIFNK